MAIWVTRKHFQCAVKIRTWKYFVLFLKYIISISPAFVEYLIIVIKQAERTEWPN